MMRMLLIATAAALLAGCWTTPKAVECRIDPPPPALLEVPRPLPPVPADLPRR